MAPSSSSGRSRLDFAGTWSGNYTIEVDINVQGDVPRRGVTWQTTNFGNGDGGYGYAVEVLSTSIEIRRGTNSSAGGTSTQLASHTFSPKLAYGWYRLKVVKSGSTYTVSLAGVQYLSVTDATYSAAGYIALRNRNGETNVSITDQYDNFGVMQSKTGTWTSPSTSINSVATVAYSIITWDQSLSVGAFPLVQSSIDGGTTWKTCTSGAFLPLLGKGSSGTGKSVLIKVSFSVTSTQFMPIIRNLVWTVSGGYVASGTRTTVPLAIDYMQRANQSGFGTASDGQTYTKSGTGTDAISGNEATITNTTGDVYERLGSKTAADSEASTRFELSASTIFAGVCLRFTDSNNLYRCIYNNGTLKLEKLVAGVLTTLASASVSPFSVTWSRLRLRIVGSTLYGRMWPDGIVESTSWMLTTTDSAFASGGFALFANGTGVASFDDFRVTSYPDPALALEPVGRLGSSVVGWNANLPSAATTLGMFTSLRGDGSDWVDISAQNGGSISGLYPQPDPTIDGFGVDSHLLYDSSFQGYQGYDNPIRPNQSGWGTASDGQPWTELTASGVTFAVSSNELTATGSVNAFVQALGSSTLSDCDVAARLASTSASDVLAVAFRITASNTYYFVRIGGGTLEIRKSVAGVITSLVSQVFTTTANTFYRVRGRVIGTTLQCKAFVDGANDPGWMLSVTDSAIAGPGQFGLRHALNAAGNTASSDQFLAAFVISGEAPPGPAISTWDTTKSRLVLQGGTNALVLQRGVSRADIDVLTTLDYADAGGLVFRMVDYSNFYALVIADASSSVGTPNRVTLYKYVAGAATQLAQATIAFTRNTFRNLRVSMLLGQITATFDGAALLSYNDASPLSAGNVGFYQNGGLTGARYYQLWIQPQGDSLINTYVYTKQAPATTDSTVTPQLLDMTVAVFNPNIGPGALIPAVDYRHQFMDKVGDDLVKQSVDYSWYIDQNFQFYFRKRTAIPAPWVLYSLPFGVAAAVDLEADSNLQVTVANDLYRNRQTLTGVINSGIFSDTFIGDGSKQSFTLRYPVAPGTIPTILLNNNPQSVALKGQSGAQWYYAVGDATIAQDTGGVVLISTDTLSVPNYTGTFTDTITIDNVAAQQALAVVMGGTGIVYGTGLYGTGLYGLAPTSTGIVENVEDVSSRAMSYASGLVYAGQLLARWCINNARTMTFTTLRNGLQVGQLLPVFVPEEGIWDGQFLITAIDPITIKTQPNDTIQYNFLVTASELPPIASWSKLLGSGLLFT